MEINEEEKPNKCDNEACDFEGSEEEGTVCPVCGIGEMKPKEEFEEEEEKDEEFGDIEDLEEIEEEGTDEEDLDEETP